jgi:hypothetical protein
MVDRVEKEWEDLDLKILGGDREEELQDALHTWICWNKRYIRFPQGTTNSAASAENSRPRLPTPPNSMGSPSPPAQRGPSMDLPSPSPQKGPIMDPPSPAAQSDSSMSSLRKNPPKKASARPPKKASGPPPPKAKKNPVKKKEKPPPPKLAYEMTNED